MPTWHGGVVLPAYKESGVEMRAFNNLTQRFRDIKRFASFVFAWLLVAALCCLCFVGCAKQEEQQQPQQEAASAEQATAPASEEQFPEAYFLTSVDGSSSGSKWAIADQDGNIARFADDAWEPLGPCSEGYVFVSWETSEYDEEWDTEHDKVTHYGLVDKTGNMAIELTEKLNAAVPDFSCGSGSADNVCFVDGILLLFGQGWDGSDRALIALNTNGDIVYTLGEKDCQIPFDLIDNSGAYHDGVLYLTGPGSGSLILDTSGNVLARSEDSGQYLTSYGNGYMSKGYDPTTVTDYAGNVLFDIESVNVKDDIENAEIFDDQPGAGGLVAVYAEKVNPYGGSNKQLAGLWSIPANKWIVPLSEGFGGSAVANDGLVRVSVDAKEFITEGYGAEDADTSEDYVCLMDYEGNIVADLDTEIVKNAIQKKSLWREKLVGDYLQNSLWLFCDKSSQGTVSLVAYIADGAVQNMKALDYDIEGTYPNNRG